MVRGMREVTYDDHLADEEECADEVKHLKDVVVQHRCDVYRILGK